MIGTYYHGDQIGSSRLLTAAGGWPVWQGTFLPFGEEYSPQTTTNHYKFTGKERDAESGLDYFGARYYSSTLGRWLSADWSAVPAPVPYADFGDPQSLNLYSYVRNLPTTKVDADGHCSRSNPCSVDDWSNGRIYTDPGTGLAIDQGDPVGNIRAAQQALSIWSFVPGVNVLFAIPNIGLAAMQGQRGEAMAQAAAIVPFEKAAASVWKLGNFARGAVVERMLGANLGHTFPVIDKWMNGVATSIKSLDLNAKTYQSLEKLAAKINGYVDRLASFKGAQQGAVKIAEKDIVSRQLELAIPEGASAAQQAVINDSAQRAAKMGVTVTVKEIR